MDLICRSSFKQNSSNQSKRVRMPPPTPPPRSGSWVGKSSSSTISEPIQNGFLITQANQIQPKQQQQSSSSSNNLSIHPTKNTKLHHLNLSNSGR